MRKFTKLMLTLTLCVFGLGVANAEKWYADLSKITTVGGTNATWDGETKTISWINYSNNMVSNFDFPAGDYSTWDKIAVNIASLNNADGIRVQIHFSDGSEPAKDFKGTGLVSMKLSEFGDKAKLATVQWIRMLGCGYASGDSHNINSDNPGSATIKEVYLERPDVVYLTEKEVIEAPAGTTDLKLLTGTEANWANTVTYPKVFAVQGASFGDGNGDKESTHVDISAYDYICFYVTEAESNSVALRVWIWDGSGVVTLYPHPIADYATATAETYKTEYRITAPGTYVAKVTGYNDLKGVKAANNWGAPSVTVSMAWVNAGDAPVDYTPSGKTTIVGAEYLDNEDVTGFDVTALSGSGLTLDAANPNALFIANEGTLANTKNVIVDGVCANLELTDQKPFKAPVDFTATAASFTKTVTDADYATLVLPFNAALPTGVEAYNATSVTNSVINTTVAESIVANKPVLLKNEGTYKFTAENVEVAAVEGVQTNGLLNGVYATTDVPTENGYVLQNQGGNVKFFKAIAGTTVKAFRAYLAANNADARLGFDFETTGIKKVENAAANNGEFFNLAGQRVAQPTKGLYIMNGKKFIK